MDKTIDRWKDPDGNGYAFKDEVARAQNRATIDKMNAETADRKTELDIERKRIDNLIKELPTGAGEYQQSKLVLHSYDKTAVKCGTTSGNYTNVPAFTTDQGGPLSSLYTKKSNYQIAVNKSGLYLFELRIHVNSLVANKRVELAPFINGVRNAALASSYNTAGDFTLTQVAALPLWLSANDTVDFRIAPIEAATVSLQLGDVLVYAIDWEDKFKIPDYTGYAAETKDIRTGANGVVYGTAGEAVRAQVSALTEDLANKTYVQSAGDIQAVSLSNYIVRDVVPEGGTANMVKLIQEDFGYIRIVKEEGLGTKYAGVYVEISWDDPSELEGLWYIESKGNNYIPHGKLTVLRGFFDWGESNKIDISNYGSLNTGVDLEKAVREKGDEFINNKLYIIPHMAYISSGATDAMDIAVRVVRKQKTKQLVKATHLTEELTEELIEKNGEYIAKQLSDGKMIAVDAGFLLPTFKTKHSNNKEHLVVSENEKKIFFNFNGATNLPANIENGLFLYALCSIEAKNYLLNKSKVMIKMNNSNYSGNDNDSLIITKCFICGNSYSWGNNTYVNLSNMFRGNPSNIIINFGDYYESLQDKEELYLLFGVDIVTRNANADGTYTVSFPPTTIMLDIKILPEANDVIATQLIGFNKEDYYTKNEIDEKIKESEEYITDWGDSLTAGGGWTSLLGELAGMPVYNAGTGGENARTIMARQGADAMIVDNITIPADKTPVTISTMKDDKGISTYFGGKATPLLQGGAHVNPVKIGNIEGTLKWTGASYNDTSGTWTFTRSEAGEVTVVDRPTVIRTEFDRNKNSPYLMIIFMGQNGGYESDLDKLVQMHKLMIQHSNTKHYVVLGLSSGTASQRKEYENKMKQEFGRYFISLREYLSHPIYNSLGEIVSCYGLADQGLEPGSKEYNGVTYNALEEIAAGTVPHQILNDSVHYTTGTKEVIGKMLYKKCCELNIF